MARPNSGDEDASANSPRLESAMSRRGGSIENSSGRYQFFVVWMCPAIIQLGGSIVSALAESPVSWLSKLQPRDLERQLSTCGSRRRSRC